MISKPIGYEESRVAGEFERLPAGGYICQIVGVEVQLYKGSPRMLLNLDIADGKFKGYFKEQQQAFNSQNWGCVFRQNVEGQGLPYFKGLITSIDESNQGFKCFQGEQLDERRLVGKYVGFVFGEEEYINKENKLKIMLKPQSPRSVGFIRSGECTAPELKKLKNEPTLQQQGFEELNDAQLPF